MNELSGRRGWTQSLFCIVSKVCESCPRLVVTTTSLPSLGNRDSQGGGGRFSFHDFRARWLYTKGKKTVMRRISLGRSGRQILL